MIYSIATAPMVCINVSSFGIMFVLLGWSYLSDVLAADATIYWAQLIFIGRNISFSQ